MQGNGDGVVCSSIMKMGQGWGERRKDIRWWEVIFAGSMSGKGRTGFGVSEREKAERGISLRLRGHERANGGDLD